MKKIILLTFLSSFLLSCSSKLTEEKIKNLVTECLIKNPIKAPSGLLYGGKIPAEDVNDESNYRKLEKNGFIRMVYKEEKTKFNTEKYYLITPTNKLKPYIINEITSSDLFLYEIRIFTYAFEKVETININPNNPNTALVEITYKQEKTPICEFLNKDNNLKDYMKSQVIFKKTENKGWIYCE